MVVSLLLLLWRISGIWYFATKKDEGGGKKDEGGGKCGGGGG